MALNDQELNLISKYLGTDVSHNPLSLINDGIPSSQIHRNEQGVISIRAQLHPSLNRIIFQYALSLFCEEELGHLIKTIKVAKNLVSQMDEALRNMKAISSRIKPVKLDIGITFESLYAEIPCNDYDVDKGLKLVSDLVGVLRSIISADKLNLEQRQNDLLTNIIAAAIIKLEFWTAIIEKQLVNA